MSSHHDTAPTGEQLQAAVMQYQPLARKMLRQYDCAAYLDEVMDTAVSELWRSLPRWRNAPHAPTLGQWAKGVVQNSVREWLRTDRPAAKKYNGASAMPLHEVTEEAHIIKTDLVEQTRRVKESHALLQFIKAQYIEHYGVQAWESLEAHAHHSTRGAQARERALALLAVLTGHVGQS